MRLFSVALAACAMILAAGLTACSSDDGKPSGNTGSSGTSSTADSGVEAGTCTVGKKKNAEPCAAPEECESNVCFIGGTQSYCTLKCTTTDAPTVCVAPLTGSCNKQGFCKRD